jgi:hypothetical protein
MITKADRRRYRLYLKKNKMGSPFYQVKDIARMEGVTPERIYQSLRKFPDWKKRKAGSGFRHKLTP